MKAIRFAALFACTFFPALSLAADLEAIPSDLAQNLAVRLSEEAGKNEKLKFKVDPDADKANGVHLPEKLGIMVVPQKGLKESDELAAKFKMDPGAPIAYVFLYQLLPVVNDKRLDENSLHSVKFNDDQGNQRVVYVLPLSVRQLDGDDYRLYGFGPENKPLIDAKFSPGSGPGAEPVAVELKDPNPDTRRGKIVITVFGKYQASFMAAHTE